MDSQNTVEMIAFGLGILFSLVLLPLGLVLYQLFDARISPAANRRVYGRSAGCSCAGQFAALILSAMLFDNSPQYLMGLSFGLLNSIIAWFILFKLAGLPEPDARIRAYWIAFVAIPAQIYAFTNIF